MRWNRTTLAACAAFALLLGPAASRGDQVAVRNTEGLVHGFLVLRTLDGSRIADGDLFQVARGARVTSRLVFHFTDGSLHDESAVFLQRRTFKLLRDRVIQKGPSFPHPLDMTIDVPGGMVQVGHMDDHGHWKTEAAHMDLPDDLANGILLTVLKNVGAVPPKSVSYVAATPKPRLVKLLISIAGREPFSTGGISRRATRYAVKVDIGGLAGAIAPLVGRQPPDSHVWILDGAAPAFVKSEQPLYDGGPLWRIELVSPAWPHAPRNRPARSP